NDQIEAALRVSLIVLLRIHQRHGLSIMEAGGEEKVPGAFAASKLGSPNPNRNYSVLLNSGTAIARATTANKVKYSISCQIATRPVSLSSNDLNPCTAKVNGSIFEMNCSHLGKAWVG